MNEQAAKNRHLAVGARAMEARSLADADKFGRRAKGYERSAAALQREADAILVTKAVATSV